MAKPRVFISHSARGDERALTLLRLLDTRLQSEGFEVLLDRTRLEVGDSWEYKIGTWLDRCHAAIVLFTTKALASDYVKFEVSNLLHRWQSARAGAGAFPLLPVLVEALTQDQLTGFYSVVNLWAVQRLGPDTDVLIADALVAKLTPLKQAASGFDKRLSGNVTAILETIPDDDFLADVARQVGVDTADWPAQKVAPRLADALVSSRMADAWQAIRLLQPRLKTRALVSNLFDLLMPCWVGPETASALNKVTVAAPGSRRALVNARTARFTTEMYLARAKAQRASLAGAVVPVRIDDLGTNLKSGLKARVSEQLEALLGVNDADRELPTTLVQQLELRAIDDPVVVAVKTDKTSLPAVIAVAQDPDFSRATFLALSSGPIPDEDSPDIIVLRPPVPVELEDAAYQQYKQYEARLKQL